MKKGQKKPEKNQGILKYIIGKLAPFLEKYPDKTGNIANLFLSAIDVVKINDQFALMFLEPVERLKSNIKYSIVGSKKEKEKQQALLEFMFHDIQMAALVIAQVNSDIEMEEIKNHFKTLRAKTTRLEPFLIKELNLSMAKNDSQGDMLSSMLLMHRTAYAKEDFTLNGKINIEAFKKAVRKYYQQLGGTVEFRYDNFDYKVGEEEGWGTVTQLHSGSVMVTTG